MGDKTFADVKTLDHMTHIDNLASIISYGLLAHNNAFKKVDISNVKVNNRRARKEPVYKKSIHDYVPFYFNARNAMLYRNKDKNIIILGFTKKLVRSSFCLFTDKNAACKGANFYHQLSQLNQLNWKRIFSDTWSTNDVFVQSVDESLRSEMMAEFLIPSRVDVRYLETIYCKDQYMKSYILRHFSIGHIQVEVNPYLFFQEEEFTLDDLLSNF